MASGNGGGSRIVGATALRSAFGAALLFGVACGGNSKIDKSEDGDGGNASGGVSGSDAGTAFGGGGVGGGTTTGGSGNEAGEGGNTDTGGDAGVSGTGIRGGSGGSGAAAGRPGKGGAGPGGAGGAGGRGGASTGGFGGNIIVFGGASGTGGGMNPGPCIATGSGLRGVLRDFQPTWMGVAGHPDFEPQVTKPSAANFFNMVETGIVQTRISDTVNRKPVYAHGVEGSNTTIGPAYFPSWFSDVPGVNVSFTYYLEFVESQTTPGIWVFDKVPFLPIDDGPACPVMPQTPCMLGNSRNYATHNYALTYEFHTRFVYKTGMSFLFSGDDDVWVFVNDSLVVDLGGIHQRSETRLNLDAISGLVVGQAYNLDFFWAERHVTQSNFHIETSLDLINCSIDVPR